LKEDVRSRQEVRTFVVPKGEKTKVIGNCATNAVGYFVYSAQRLIERTATLPLQSLSKMILGAPQELAKPTNLRDTRYILLRSTLGVELIPTSLAARESHRLQPPQPTSNQSSSPTPFPTTLNPSSWVYMGFLAVGRPSCSIS
jgi:hypothetical protein